MLSLQIRLPLNFHTPSLLSTRAPNSLSCRAASTKSDPEPAKPKPRRRKTAPAGNETEQKPLPFSIPKKPPRRGRRSEAAAVEDYVRDSLNRTFAAIQEQNPEIFEAKAELMKKKAAAADDGDEEDDEESEEEEAAAVVEEETENWPLDAEVGWGIRASEYFEKHGIRNVVDENGDEIDWEGEVEDNWVKEINCLEWESFAFHPSPLIVFVFERYNRAGENWKALKELEKAVKVYWDAKERLPPRSVKIDINIERDLAYALKVRECPQVLFLRGNRILYREKEIRTSDELVAMIAHFYYNAKRPSWIDVKELTLPYK
ncbi:thioredoxin-like fold domain-containing protein MRL7, chloroplastic [Argentina anserina]|uniref:thioredoxin-like fold domain-containing protein MRL7, chloroplastic n=1 Tax=Argentina anserina TaxID=57926 RepID=UPI00217694BE|nr:thioredoxin-like fold domain-containing protein MRL7, chloroplastic [Potentilla anserina]